MKTIHRTFGVTAVAFVPFVAWIHDGTVPAPKAAAPVITLVPAVTRAEIEAHVRFLAADEQKGRVTGTPEADACARYLAGVFEREHVAPAGDDGTFLQRVPLVRTSQTAAPELTFVDAQGAKTALVSRRDFSASGGVRSTKLLRVVVAHNAPELPKSADPEIALFFDGSSRERNQALEDMHLDGGKGFGLILVPGLAKAAEPTGPFSPQQTITLKSRTHDDADRRIRVHGEMLDRLRAGTVKSVQFDAHGSTEDVVGSNVVAKIVGVGTTEHPELALEAVVVTAHYDHLDVAHTGAHATGADQIWNGADDDASGTVAVLEIAGALAAGTPPARTVVFVLVTGEEVGLLGTDEYLDRPVVPLDKTVVNLNFEMIGRPDPKVGGAGELWFTGFELSNLGPAYAAAKLAIHADPYPAQNFFQRSDNIAFVNRGIVGQTLSTYNLHKDYHQPSDEADTLDYAHMEACTKAGLEAVRMVASGSIRPAWLEGKTPRRR